MSLIARTVAFGRARHCRRARWTILALAILFACAAWAEPESSSTPLPAAEHAGTPRSALNPEPSEFPKPEQVSPSTEYQRLLTEIAKLRSRVAALTTALFQSKLRIWIQTRADTAAISRLLVTVDDGVVFVAPARFSAEDQQVVYEHAIVPGHHFVGVEIERYDTRRREYQTYQKSRFSVVVPESRLVETELVLQDSSSMAEDFPDDQEGEYDLRVRLRAHVAD